MATRGYENPTSDYTCHVVLPARADRFLCNAEQQCGRWSDTYQRRCAVRAEPERPGGEHQAMARQRLQQLHPERLGAAGQTLRRHVFIFSTTHRDALTHRAHARFNTVLHIRQTINYHWKYTLLLFIICFECLCHHDGVL